MSVRAFTLQLGGWIVVLDPLVAEMQQADLVTTRRGPDHEEFRLLHTIVGRFDTSVEQQTELPAPSPWVMTADRIDTKGSRVVYEIRRIGIGTSNATRVIWKKQGFDYDITPLMLEGAELRIYDFAVISNALYVVYSEGPLMVDEVRFAEHEVTRTNSYTLRGSGFFSKTAEIGISTNRPDVVIRVKARAPGGVVEIPLRFDRQETE